MLAGPLHRRPHQFRASVCWLFVGSSIFSAAFALLGGQALIEEGVFSLELTPLQFLILAQLVIFLLGWPLEWTEIIVIFMPIFIALNLQTAFLSPPVAMAALYLKGVAPPPDKPPQASLLVSSFSVAAP